MQCLRKLTPALAAIALSLVLVGCPGSQPPRMAPEANTSISTVKGHVTFEAPLRKTQATLTEVANAATVSLIDATTGNTVASSVTDASGAFVLTFSNFTPTTGAPYILEAIKGLAVGGKPNRAGVGAVRVRTLLFWNNGWQSLTNSTPGQGITVSVGTTALSTIASLRQLPSASMSLLINTVSATDSSFVATGTGLSNASDYQPVLALVSNAITLDQDPLEAIAYNNGSYAIATEVPSVTSITPAIGTPGTTLSIKGSNFDRLDGRNAFWFGRIPASTWSVSADKTTATVTVPSNAYSAPFTLQQPGGVVQTLDPFYKLRGTVGTLAGNGIASHGDGVGISAQFISTYGVAVDTSGNLYVADYAGHRIRKVSPAGMASTLAGSGLAGGADGTGTSAQFNGPVGLAVDTSGNLYVSEYGGHRIRKITPAGVVSTVAGSGVAGFADGTGTSAQFNSPYGVAVDTSGNLYSADINNHRVRKITPAGVVSTLAGSGVAGFADGTGTSAQFNQPIGIAVEASGNLYVSELTGQRIRKVTPAGVVSTVAGSGVGGLADGTGTSAQFNQPYGVAIDSSGNLYVADLSNHKIRKVVVSTGVVTTVAGTGVAAYSDGATSSAELNAPVGIAVETSGNLYIGDYGNRRIRVITP